MNCELSTVNFRWCPASSSPSNTPARKYSGWQKQKNARTVQGEIEDAIARGDRPAAVRVPGLGPHRRRRPCAPSGGAPRRPQRAAPPETAAPRASTRIFPPTSTSWPSRRRRRGFMPATRLWHAATLTRSRLGDWRSPSLYVWWVKEALDVERMAAAAAAPSPACTTSGPSSDDDPEEKSTDVLIEAAGARRGRRPDSGARDRLSLPVEDGAAHGRRAGRSRPRQPHGERRRPDAPVRRPDARPLDGARVRPVP